MGTTLKLAVRPFKFGSRKIKVKVVRGSLVGHLERCDYIPMVKYAPSTYSIMGGISHKPKYAALSHSITP